jgi:benzylsuccinate CoA-transferase BbsF subunit
VTQSSVLNPHHSPLPLEGYRVVDFGWVIAGPIVGAILADMGAEVIKVESRRRLDASRRGRPIAGGHIDRGDRGEEPDLIPLFHAINRNKLSIAIDLTHPQAPHVLKDLIARSDVVVENFTPHVLRSFGLHYEALCEVKPDLIMLSLSAAGQTGPLCDISAYAPSVTSLAGLEGLVGYPDGPILGMPGLNFSDPTAGLLGAYAVMAALSHRQRTGQGQYIDMSQIEVLTGLAVEAILDYTLNSRVRTPQGNQHPYMAPHGVYPCQGEDQWVALAVGSEAEWLAFGRGLGDPGWTRDARCTDGYRRVRHRTWLDQQVAAWTRKHSASDVSACLRAAGVAVAPVMGIAQQFADPHYRARQVYVEIEHPRVGVETIYNVPWKLSATPGTVRRPAPSLGQHHIYVFRELLGLSQEDIERLLGAGVFT